jgi:hypothetical protein
MPGKLFTTYTDFANVPATGVASANLPIGKTVEQIHLLLGGGALTKAMVTQVRILANAKPIYEVSAGQIDKINAFRGQTNTAAVISIDFTEQFGRDIFDEVVGGFDTSQGINSLGLEVTVAGATTPTIKMQTVQSAPQRGPVLGKMANLTAMIRRTAYAMSAAGTLQVLLPKGDSGGLIKRIHVEAAAGLVTDVNLKQNGVEVYKSPVALNSAYLTFNRRVPQALWASLDFVADGTMQNWLDATDPGQLELLPTFSGADSGFVIIEMLNTLNRAV